GECEPERRVEVALDPGCHRLVGHAERTPEPGQISEAFVDAVLLDVRSVAPHDREEPLGEEAIRLVVGGENDRLRTDLPDVGQAHAADHTARLGLVTHRGCNAPFQTGDDRSALELRVTGLLAGSKKRIAVDVNDGAGKRTQHEWLDGHGYLRTSPTRTAA